MIFTRLGYLVIIAILVVAAGAILFVLWPSDTSEKPAAATSGATAAVVTPTPSATEPPAAPPATEPPPTETETPEATEPPAATETPEATATPELVTIPFSRVIEFAKLGAVLDLDISGQDVTVHFREDFDVSGLNTTSHTLRSRLTPGQDAVLTLESAGIRVNGDGGLTVTVH
jgi:type IV secretory pathway VirB10-like protein